MNPSQASSRGAPTTCVSAKGAICEVRTGFTSVASFSACSESGLGADGCSCRRMKEEHALRPRRWSVMHTARRLFGGAADDGGAIWRDLLHCDATPKRNWNPHGPGGAARTGGQHGNARDGTGAGDWHSGGNRAVAGRRTRGQRPVVWLEAL